jgi:hypothetical protein
LEIKKIEINQSRPPSKISFLYVNKFFYCILVGNNHRLVFDRFQFTHKIIEGLEIKKWKLFINYPRTSSSNKQIPFYLTLKFPYAPQPNYGKFEIICKNKHNLLRPYIETIEDLMDNYSIEFFTLDELSANIYKYTMEIITKKIIHILFMMF